MIRFRQKTQGMSLVEILVVVACIALLVALLIPAFANMQRKSQSVYCMNTLRALGQANQTYAAEYGHFINSFEPYVNGVPNGSWWWGDKADNNKLGIYFDVQGTGVGGMLVCPSAKNHKEENMYPWMYNYLSYGYNTHLAGTPPARVSQPANKVMFMDAMVYAMEEYHSGFASDGAFRHSGKANIVFADGHCEARALESLSYPVNLGSFLEP